MDFPRKFGLGSADKSGVSRAPAEVVRQGAIRNLPGGKTFQVEIEVLRAGDAGLIARTKMLDPLLVKEMEDSSTALEPRSGETVNPRR